MNSYLNAKVSDLPLFYEHLYYPLLVKISSSLKIEIFLSFNPQIKILSTF